MQTINWMICANSGDLFRKVDRLGYDEAFDRGRSRTPARRVTRQSAEPSANDISDYKLETQSTRKRSIRKTKIESTPDIDVKPTVTNGEDNLPVPEKPQAINEQEEAKDPRIDYSGHFEFGGSLGVLCMMIGFPLLMYYMWIGATFYDGKFPRRLEGQTWTSFFAHLSHLVYEGAFPSLKAWTIYWVFFIFEAVCYVALPGVTLSGRPLPHLGGKQLPYYCSAVWSFYTSIALILALHFTGIFKLYTIIDEFGPLLSVAIISGYLVSFIAYFSALARGAQHRMTGYPIYDFFMGAELNPRMFGILDFKMFFEVRLPWFILLFLTMGTAARQYETYGYVSGEVGFLLMAHFLYANACCKGEECIVSTWWAWSFFAFLCE